MGETKIEDEDSFAEVEDEDSSEEKDVAGGSSEKDEDFEQIIESELAKVVK